MVPQKVFEAPQRSAKKNSTFFFSLRPGLGQEGLKASITVDFYYFRSSRSQVFHMLKFSKIHKKTLALDSLFSTVAGHKNTFFTDNLRTTASVTVPEYRLIQNKVSCLE